MMNKLQAMKEEQCQLSCEAHECVDSIPGLNKMVYAVQALSEFPFAIELMQIF